MGLARAILQATHPVPRPAAHPLPSAGRRFPRPSFFPDTPGPSPYAGAGVPADDFGKCTRPPDRVDFALPAPYLALTFSA